MDRLRDPFYAHLMFLIEQTIWAADDDAGRQGILLKDSQVQSALTKARDIAAGKSPKIGAITDADKILQTMIFSLSQPRGNFIVISGQADALQQEKPIQVEDWIIAIETVIKSIKSKRSQIPGLRTYLDFLKDFIPRVKREK